jgi:hypothetical protein
MTYIIIHPNRGIQEKHLAKIVKKYIKEDMDSLEKTKDDPNFFIVEPGESGSIKIEQTKALQKNLIYSPFSKKYQFGIILDAQLMTVEAQNSLLKTFEESHDNTIIILTTNNERRVLPTILSRCNRIYPNEKEEILEKKTLSEEEAFLKKPVYEKIEYVEKIVKEEKTYEFLDNLMEIFRDKYNAKLAEEKDVKKEKEALEMLSQAKYRISKNVNKKIALEYICFKLSEK